jgi:hypothetical protein
MKGRILNGIKQFAQQWALYRVRTDLHARRDSLTQAASVEAEQLKSSPIDAARNYLLYKPKKNLN